MKKILLALSLGTICLSANAYSTYYVPNTDSPTYQFNVIEPGEYIYAEGKQETSAFSIPQDYIYPILLAATDWNEKAGIYPNKPMLYYYYSESDYNAAAESPYVVVSGQPYKHTITQAVLHGWTYTPPPATESTGDATIDVGLGVSETFPGWEPYTGKHALYHGALPDLYSVMKHEIMHSLGVATAAEQYKKVETDPTSDERFFFSKSVTDPISIYDSYLRVYQGADDPISDPSNEIAPSMGQAIGTGPGEYNIDSFSPYLVGENVIKVLGDSNDYNTARQNIVNQGGMVNYSDAYYDDKDPESVVYPTVYGMPIHPTDLYKKSGNTEYDLSHFELRNSYMSHQDFRNWLTPMEAELAVMNDLGYNIDLRKYFGKSYYLNGRTDTYNEGFSKWDGSTYTNEASTTDQAVGIHIYGSNNNITQSTKNIEMSGEGSIGVRIDGANNTYTLEDADIHANGKENIGIAVTYGSKHTVNINNGTEVTAIGEDGIAASFDFGGNLFGTADSVIKGSYINYVNDDDVSPDVDNQGELVTDFNVNGALAGSKAAIYISDNAYVKNINVGDGAEINGDIVSEWNSIQTLDKASVQVKNGDEWEDVNPLDPSEFRHTNLNFNTSSGVGVNGNIKGDNKTYNTIKMSNASGSTVNFNGNEININSLDNDGDININKNSNITTFEDEITGDGNINVSSGASLRLSPNITTVGNTLNLNGASFDMANGSIGSTTFSNLTLSGNNSTNVDVDIATKTSDTIKFNNPADLTVNPGASLQISKVNLMNANRPYTDQEYYVPFVSPENNNQNLLGKVSLADRQTVMTPIFKYNLGYRENLALNQGGFSFSRGATKDYNSYNPAVTVAPVAAQFGGYLNQLNSYEQAFQNFDMKMLMTREERQALKMSNLYASTGAPMVYSPTYLPEENKGAWFRPYATFEKADLKNGPKVENISYGSYFGGDTPIYETKNGWDYQYSLYAGYNGSHQNYSGNSIYQNGGTLGGTVMWNKDNFFTALTANAGASAAKASTMYGSEDMTMLMAGVASKTGYNWELAKGKFIIQPSYLMSYSFVNTFNYTNAAGIKIKPDPLNAINIAPGLKFIGNLKNGWQPYIGMQMVWSIMDKTDFKANNVALPDMSVKPYFQYGVGVQKRWGDRFTGFFQTMVRNGGRNGVALTAGFRWALGK